MGPSEPVSGRPANQHKGAKLHRCFCCPCQRKRRRKPPAGAGVSRGGEICVAQDFVKHHLPLAYDDLPSVAASDEYTPTDAAGDNLAQQRPALTPAALVARVLGLLALWMPAQADAVWKQPREIAQGTAQVLERGEIRIGFTSPVAYGVLDSLTIETHPIFDLLLMPNVSARLRVVDEPGWLVSLFGGYKQGFFSDAQNHIEIGRAHV